MTAEEWTKEAAETWAALRTAAGRPGRPADSLPDDAEGFYAALAAGMGVLGTAPTAADPEKEAVAAARQMGSEVAYSLECGAGQMVKELAAKAEECTAAGRHDADPLIPTGTFTRLLTAGESTAGLLPGSPPADPTDFPITGWNVTIFLSIFTPPPGGQHRRPELQLLHRTGHDDRAAGFHGLQPIRTPAPPGCPGRGEPGTCRRRPTWHPGPGR